LTLFLFVRPATRAALNRVCLTCPAGPGCCSCYRQRPGMLPAASWSNRSSSACGIEHQTRSSRSNPAPADSAPTKAIRGLESHQQMKAVEQFLLIVGPAPGGAVLTAHFRPPHQSSIGIAWRQISSSWQADRRRAEGTTYCGSQRPIRPAIDVVSVIHPGETTQRQELKNHWDHCSALTVNRP